MKWFITVTMIALLAFGVLVGLMISAAHGGDDPVRKVGVGLCVDDAWVALEGFYVVRDRGTAARVQAWAGGEPSRGASSVRTVRLWKVPNVVARARHASIAMRTMGSVAHTVVRHVLFADAGGRDADSR